MISAVMSHIRFRRKAPLDKAAAASSASGQQTRQGLTAQRRSLRRQHFPEFGKQPLRGSCFRVNGVRLEDALSGIHADYAISFRTRLFKWLPMTSRLWCQLPAQPGNHLERAGCYRLRYRGGVLIPPEQICRGRVKIITEKTRFSRGLTKSVARSLEALDRGGHPFSAGL